MKDGEFMTEQRIFETHAHFDSKQFDEDRDELLRTIHEAGEDAAERKVPVGQIINVGADMKGSRASVGLAHEYDFVKAAVGIHPDEAGEIVYCGKADEAPAADDDNQKNEGSGQTADAEEEPCRRFTMEECAANFAELRGLALDPQTVAIGEIGLDYHWDIWSREIQKEAFIKQWDLADELGLPIIIHSRDAAEDTMEIVRERYLAKAAGQESGLRAIMHCYSYSVEQAREYLRMGLYFGIGGVVTFKNAKKLKEAVAELPMDRLLLETDCPYMAPEPFRGKRNDSGKISYVAEMIAQLKDIPVEEVYRITYQNAVSFFEKPLK